MTVFAAHTGLGALILAVVLGYVAAHGSLVFATLSALFGAYGLYTIVVAFSSWGWRTKGVARIHGWGSLVVLALMVAMMISRSDMRGQVDPDDLSLPLFCAIMLAGAWASV